MSPHTTVRGRTKFPIALGAAIAILVASLVAVPSIAVVSATTTPPPASGSSTAGTWSFGNVTTVSVQGKDYQGSYSGSATYGFVTNITAINTSATTIEVVVQETVGVSLSLEYLPPELLEPGPGHPVLLPGLAEPRCSHEREHGR